MTCCAGAAILGFSALLFHEAHVAPATGSLFRALFALPALLLLAAYERRATRPAAVDAPWAWQPAALAGVALGVDLVIWHTAVDDVGAGLATVLGNTQVVFVALASALWLGESLRPSTIAGVAVLLGGVVLVSGALDASPFGNHPVRGAVCGVLAGAAYAAFVVLLRGANTRRDRIVPPLIVATAAAAGTSLVLGAVVGAVDLVPDAQALAWLLALALSAQVLGWLLISSSIQRLSALTTSVTLTLQPVAAVLSAALLLGEEPSLLQLLGGGVVLAGFLLVTVGRGAPSPANRAERP